MGKRRTTIDALGQLETQLSVFARRIENVARQSVLYRNMDRAGYLLARTIEATGPASVNQLADALHLDGSTVTRQVSALEAKGYVDRTVDPADGRASIIVLTEAGRTEMETVRAARRVKIGAMVAGWEPADVSRFGELLEQFNGSMVNVDVAADVATGIGR